MWRGRGDHGGDGAMDGAPDTRDREARTQAACMCSVGAGPPDEGGGMSKFGIYYKTQAEIHKKQKKLLKTKSLKISKHTTALLQKPPHPKENRPRIADVSDILLPALNAAALLG